MQINKTQEALKMAIAYAQDVKRGSAIVPTYHDVIINACKEALEIQEQSACEECIGFNNKLAEENDRLISQISELERVNECLRYKLSEPWKPKTSQEQENK